GRVAETAVSETLFDAAGHPYTQALMASVPALDVRSARLNSIPGTVPGVGHMPRGCRFAPRCSFSRPVCTEVPPPPLALGPGQAVACLKPFEYRPVAELVP